MALTPEGVCEALGSSAVGRPEPGAQYLLSRVVTNASVSLGLGGPSRTFKPTMCSWMREEMGEKLLLKAPPLSIPGGAQHHATQQLHVGQF